MMFSHIELTTIFLRSWCLLTSHEQRNFIYSKYILTQKNETFFNIDIEMIIIVQALFQAYSYLKRWKYIISNVLQKMEVTYLHLVTWKWEATHSIWRKWFSFYTINLKKKTFRLEAQLIFIFTKSHTGGALRRLIYKRCL